MKLDCVLTACNMNKLYYDFIPLFINTWIKLYPTVNIVIVLINETLPEDLQKYEKYIRCFKPIEGISTAFISQYIRLLYPCLLNYKNGVIITDIDIIPMNNSYFTKNIENFENNKWINFREWSENNMIAMAYQVACPNVWKEVFNINSINDINNRLMEKNKNIKYSDGKHDKYWFTDQNDLFKYVMGWNKRTNNYIYLKDNDTNFNRLDRGMNIIINNNLINNIKRGKYTDFHMVRPYNLKNINTNIINLL